MSAAFIERSWQCPSLALPATAQPDEHRMPHEERLEALTSSGLSGPWYNRLVIACRRWYLAPCCPLEDDNCGAVFPRGVRGVPRADAYLPACRAPARTCGDAEGRSVAQAADAAPWRRGDCRSDPAARRDDRSSSGCVAS